MSENWIVQIDFKDQSKYELNKGFIKDIIKRKHKLSNFNAMTQRWYSSTIPDVEVKRVTDGIKTIGLMVSDSKEVADSLVSYLKDMSGVSITWLNNSIDKEVLSIVRSEVYNYRCHLDRRVEKGEITKEKEDYLLDRWASAVASYEYTKRGVEY